MNNKVLTIAIPSFNRSKFLSKSLERIILQLKGFEDQVELMVSDNCSTDGTQLVVKKLIEEGAPIIYNRNSSNIGMDANFVYCLQNATARYLWILGDDDHLVNDAIPKILSILRNNEYGLIHLNKNINEGMVIKEYTNKRRFVADISFMKTFISANIVRTEIVKKIDLNKYVGSFFSFLPVYLTAVISKNKNLIIYLNAMDMPADSENNGGYNIFDVFVIQYLNILFEFKSKFGYVWYEIEKYKLFRGFIYGWMLKLLINSNHKFRFKTDDWFKIIFSRYWYEPYFYPMFVIFFLKKIRIKSNDYNYNL